MNPVEAVPLAIVVVLAVLIVTLIVIRNRRSR